uniref:Ig-like domain-containing protein n=1 Tax=Prolemur simus TaxID=1328070 RepID=A0A8C8ZNF0_PROSS
MFLAALLPIGSGDQSCYFFFSTGSSMCQQVIQSQVAISKQEGETVELECSYNTSVPYYMLYWYKRPPSGEIIFLIFQRTDADTNATQGRYSVSFQKAAKTIRLIISSSQPEDSATYFCCLREPTVKKVIEELYKKVTTRPEAIAYSHILSENSHTFVSS